MANCQVETERRYALRKSSSERIKEHDLGILQGFYDLDQGFLGTSDIQYLFQTPLQLSSITRAWEKYSPQVLLLSGASDPAERCVAYSMPEGNTRSAQIRNHGLWMLLLSITQE